MDKNRPTDRPTDRQPDKQAEKQIDKTDIQSDVRDTDRQIDGVQSHAGKSTPTQDPWFNSLSHPGKNGSFVMRTLFIIEKLQSVKSLKLQK